MEEKKRKGYEGITYTGYTIIHGIDTDIEVGREVMGGGGEDENKEQLRKDLYSLAQRWWQHEERSIHIDRQT